MTRGVLLLLSLFSINVVFSNNSSCAQVLAQSYAETYPSLTHSQERYFLPVFDNNGEKENRAVVFKKVGTENSMNLSMTVEIKSPMDALKLYVQIYDWHALLKWKAEGAHIPRSEAAPARIIRAGHEEGILAYRLDDWQIFGWHEDWMPERILNPTLSAEIHDTQMIFTPNIESEKSSEYFFESLKRLGLLVENHPAVK